MSLTKYVFDVCTMFLKPQIYTSCLLYSTKCISLPFTLVRSEGFRHIYIWITMWVSYKKQELTILREQMSSPWVILLCPIMCLYVLLSYISVQHILCCIFVLSFFVLCTLCCQFLWIVHFWLSLRYSLTFIYLMYTMLPVSLDCPFLIVPSVFSNVYLSYVHYVASFSGLSIFYCPFGIL